MALTEWGAGFECNRMVVGPIRRASHEPSAPADGECVVGNGIFFVQTPTPAADQEQREVLSRSRSRCRSGESGSAKASSFFFGTASAVMERDESGEKLWLRERHMRDRVGWVRYERHANDPCKLQLI